jgi:hypothetical protein
VIDLIKEIRQDLEKNKEYTIDKKTVKRMVLNLAAEDLVETGEIKVTINYSGG